MRRVPVLDSTPPAPHRELITPQPYAAYQACMDDSDRARVYGPPGYSVGSRMLPGAKPGHRTDRLVNPVNPIYPLPSPAGGNVESERRDPAPLAS